ncbi:basic salivary proline-rich protein 2-like [Lepisosteus oculatus]|uniref:basic salivary proline-rich protein 2-like n=1 Tax=Lepisosteus oculatus TaxID=7918 RepID=UPI0035F52940
MWAGRVSVGVVLGTRERPKQGWPLPRHVRGRPASQVCGGRPQHPGLSQGRQGSPTEGGQPRRPGSPTEGGQPRRCATEGGQHPFSPRRDPSDRSATPARPGRAPAFGHGGSSHHQAGAHAGRRRSGAPPGSPRGETETSRSQRSGPGLPHAARRGEGASDGPVSPGTRRLGVHLRRPETPRFSQRSGRACGRTTTPEGAAQVRGTERARDTGPGARQTGTRPRRARRPRVRGGGAPERPDPPREGGPLPG